MATKKKSKAKRSTAKAPATKKHEVGAKVTVSDKDNQALQDASDRVTAAQVQFASLAEEYERRRIAMLNNIMAQRQQLRDLVVETGKKYDIELSEGSNESWIWRPEEKSYERTS